MASVLREEMVVRGFAARGDGVGNILGTIGRGPTHVYLIGHLDTVPGDLPIRLEGRTLFGRGSVDAKGSLGACVEAASGFTNSDKLTLTVIGCVGEEADSRGARRLLRTVSPPDFVIVAEPSGWNAITLGYKGSLPVRYTLEKRQAHRGAPTSTVAEDAIRFCETLYADHPDRGVRFNDLSIRLTAFNTSRDAVRERVVVMLDVRTPPDFHFDTFRCLVQEAAGGAEVEIGAFTPAVIQGKRNRLVRAMLAGIRAQQGKPVFKMKTGTSDMNLFQSWDVPMIAYGPGNSSLDHTPDERLDLDEYAAAIVSLSQGIRHLEQECA